MLSANHNGLDRLEQALCGAPQITPELFNKVITHACVRSSAAGAAAKARLDHFIQMGAWTDAALVLLELELPHWKICRLAQEDGEWFCTLSREPWLPVGTGDCRDGNHAVLVIALLIALLRARAFNPEAMVSTVPKLRSPALSPAHAICCDNFS